MSAKHRQLTVELSHVESQLRTLSLWSDRAPSPAALASRQPFAVDTLAFEEWLQFIFLPRMQHLAETGSQLPADCAVAPMAEECFRHHPADVGELVARLAAIDRLLSGPLV